MGAPQGSGPGPKVGMHNELSQLEESRVLPLACIQHVPPHLIPERES